ncbi:hypothetical protein KCU93_g2423, partial [Aureobasidium melanogenum]
MPSQGSATGALGATDVKDAMVACFLDLNSMEVKSLKLAAREALRAPCRFPAKRNIIWNDEVVCQRGEIPQIWMLENNNQARIETSRARDIMVEHHTWSRLFKGLILAEKDAEISTDPNHRYPIAPYELRMHLLDRVLATCAVEIRKNPKRRTARSDAKVQFRVVDRSKCPYQFGLAAGGVFRDNDSDDDIQIVIPIPRRKKKRTLRNTVLSLQQAGKPEQFHSLDLLCTGAVPPGQGDILISDLDIEKVWANAGVTQWGHWLKWRHENKALSVKNTERFQDMINTEYNAGKKDEFTLTIMKNPEPEDGELWDDMVPPYPTRRTS